MFRRALMQVSLVEAFRAWSKVFDRLTVTMVGEGEAGGVLDETLGRPGTPCWR